MRIVIKRGFDLRMKQAEKLFDVAYGYAVVYINNAHTIAHVVTADDPDITIRTKLPSYLKGTADTYLQKFIDKKFDWLKATKIKPGTAPVAVEREFISRRRYLNYRKRIMS